MVWFFHIEKAYSTYVEQKLDKIIASMEDVFGRIHRVQRSYRLAIGSRLAYPEHVVVPIIPEFKIFVTRVKEVCYEAVANTLLYMPAGEQIMDELRKNTKEQIFSLKNICVVL